MTNGTLTATPGLSFRRGGAPRHGHRNEELAIERVYNHLAPTNFSEDVLSAAPTDLAVLPVHGLPWSDWGRPERVLETLAELGVEPAWTIGRAAGASAS